MRSSSRRDVNVRDKGNKSNAMYHTCQSPGPDKLYSSVSGSMFFVPIFVRPALLK
jgi:hypothetical protein